MTESIRKYEIYAYDNDGERLSLSEDRAASDQKAADTIWDALGLLAAVPIHGWRHWDDGESEQMIITRIELEHSETHSPKRRSAIHTTHILETIYRRSTKN